ncbi:MAG: DeoR family transcriptional regulator [Patescibacteria group bacterium]
MKIRDMPEEKIILKFKVLVRAMYAVACGVGDISMCDKLKNYTLLLTDAFARGDLSNFEENVLAFDVVLENAAVLHFTANENYYLLSKELKRFKDEFVANTKALYSVSGIPELVNLFPETNGGEYGINLPVRETKMRLISHNKIGDPTERQRAILELLREKGNAPLMDFLIRFPELNEKTIRNDLNSLCEGGYITRIGKGGRGSRYQFVREVSSI